MTDEKRVELGKRAKFCEEGRLEIDTNKEGKIVAMKGYCKAKDFRRGGNDGIETCNK